MTAGKLDIWTDSPVARKYMSTELVTATPDEDMWTVIVRFLDNDISGAPVVDGEGALVGLISEKDLLKVLAKGSPLGLPRKLVRDIMTEPPVTIPPDMNVFTIASLFKHNAYRRLPVVEDGVLLGLICRRDLLRCMMDLGKL